MKGEPFVDIICLANVHALFANWINQGIDVHSFGYREMFSVSPKAITLFHEDVTLNEKRPLPTAAVVEANG